MEELKKDYKTEDLDKFIIEDYDTIKKKPLRHCLIITPIALVIIATIIVIVLLSIYRGGSLTCTYITFKDNEQAKLLNDNIYNKYTIKIKQGEESIA